MSIFTIIIQYILCIIENMIPWAFLSSSKQEAEETFLRIHFISEENKKAQEICLISAKLREAISVTQTIPELPSSMYLNLQWVHLQWSEQVTFLARN